MPHGTACANGNDSHVSKTPVSAGQHSMPGTCRDKREMRRHRYGVPRPYDNGIGKRALNRRQREVFRRGGLGYGIDGGLMIVALFYKQLTEED